MAVFDVFNGDADGVISLVQLRRACPRPEATLVTGRKRDINLLDRVKTKKGDHVTVLDVSMRSNMDDLKRILKSGASVFYADHHNAGDMPEHKNLHAAIDTSPEICTALIIDDCLEGAYRAWAVTAAFGDNFPKIAKAKAAGLDLPLDQLERLGMLVNYNGYGAGVEDLHFHPADLYKALAPFDTPMEFLKGGKQVFDKLNNGYESDLATAQNSKVLDESHKGLVIELADAASSRRISGMYGNQLAQENPDRAHAVLTRNGDSYVVSVRAPLSNRTGADELCFKFETGGGRSAAAGINVLPERDVDRFIDAFIGAF
ncbi:MAG: DHH family phosphoesterase [Hellea sp.]|nr:DHH family phosphoesterase [Hellea sp.]